jgi:hypothetical protein
MPKPSTSPIDRVLVANMARDVAETLSLNPQYNALENHERFGHTLETCALLIAAQYGSHHSNVDSTLQSIEGLFGKSLMAGLVLAYYTHFVQQDASTLLKGGKK